MWKTILWFFFMVFHFCNPDGFFMVFRFAVTAKIAHRKTLKKPLGLSLLLDGFFYGFWDQIGHGWGKPCCNGFPYVFRTFFYGFSVGWWFFGRLMVFRLAIIAVTANRKTIKKPSSSKLNPNGFLWFFDPREAKVKNHKKTIKWFFGQAKYIYIYIYILP